MKKTHGMYLSPEYITWVAMIQRCNNSKNPAYKNYGGRGIQICERWYKFENFYEDVGDRPEGKSLDRWPNNDGDYKPGNVRWGWRYTMKEIRICKAEPIHEEVESQTIIIEGKLPATAIKPKGLTTPFTTPCHRPPMIDSALCL